MFLHRLDTLTAKRFIAKQKRSPQLRICDIIVRLFKQCFICFFAFISKRIIMRFGGTFSEGKIQRILMTRLNGRRALIFVRVVQIYAEDI